jgi:MraZ protein
MMFRGSSFHTIDPKGRFIIPARFRDVIKGTGQDLIMITRMDGCLYAYVMDEWTKVENNILDLPQKNDAMRRFQRIFIGSCQECKCDTQGRVLIPPALKDYAGLEKEIVLVGVINRFEIWSKEKWDQENGQMDIDLGDDQVRQEIAQLRL